MAQDDEKRPQSESKKDLYFLLVILFAVGLLLVGGAAFWKQVSSESNDKLLILQIGQRMAGSGADTADGSVAQPTKPLANLITELVTGSNQQNGWVADLSRDLGIALLISVIATFLIEKYASDRLREDIARDVLSAAYLKVVPKEIFAQVADNVFRSEVYRTDWEVHINASAQQFDRAAGIAIITAKYSYELKNLKEQEISAEISAGIDLNVPAQDENIPRFTSITIGDKGKPMIPEGI